MLITNYPVASKYHKNITKISHSLNHGFYGLIDFTDVIREPPDVKDCIYISFLRHKKRTGDEDIGIVAEKDTHNFGGKKSAYTINEKSFIRVLVVVVK